MPHRPNVCTECKIAFFDVKDWSAPPSDAKKKILPLCPLCQRPFCVKCMPNHRCLFLKYKMVIVVRKDLNMSAGKTSAQSVHAGIELVHNMMGGRYDGDTICNLSALRPADVENLRLYHDWRDEGARVVVLGIENSKRLWSLKDRAEKMGLNVKAYADGGITEVQPGTVTVLGIGPDLAEKIDKVTQRLDSL